MQSAIRVLTVGLLVSVVPIATVIVAAHSQGIERFAGTWGTKIAKSKYSSGLHRRAIRW